MKLHPRHVFAAVATSIVFASVAQAHPGHDHTDIPSVLRHPFVSWDHTVITAGVLIVAGGMSFVLSRLIVEAKPFRWVGAGLIVAGVALAFV